MELSEVHQVFELKSQLINFSLSEPRFHKGLGGKLDYLLITDFDNPHVV